VSVELIDGDNRFVLREDGAMQRINLGVLPPESDDADEFDADLAFTVSVLRPMIAKVRQVFLELAP
jgi:hypothetical protein